MAVKRENVRRFSILEKRKRFSLLVAVRGDAATLVTGMDTMKRGSVEALDRGRR